MENRRLDLGDPATWDEVARFDEELTTFTGRRAVFAHNAFHSIAPSFAGEGRRADHLAEHAANFISISSAGPVAPGSRADPLRSPP